jgi:uncharacterized membrane protein
MWFYIAIVANILNIIGGSLLPIWTASVREDVKSPMQVLLGIGAILSYLTVLRHFKSYHKYYVCLN